MVTVAILSSAAFDALSVDPLTVSLASAPVRLRGNGSAVTNVSDVNNDGLLDLIVQVQTEALQLSEGDIQALLTAQITGGQSIRGIDSIRVVP